MPHLKIILFLAILSFGNSVQAEWRAVVQRMGFMGKLALGVAYEPAPEHAVEYSMGTYPVDNQDYYQSNLSYRYTRWAFPFYGNIWRPVQIGAFVVVSMDQSRYFLDSPKVYPQKNYYDSTMFRYGAEYASTFIFCDTAVGLSYHLRIFDNGLIATLNNPNRDLQYYISSGLSLHYQF